MKKYIVSSKDSNEPYDEYENQYNNLRFTYEKRLFGKLMNIPADNRKTWFQGVMDALEICDIDTSRLNFLYEAVVKGDI